MLTIALSIVLGIAIHVLWDSFTHAYTWTWRNLVWLQSWLKLPIAGWMPGYGLLQYASTLLGLLALAGWILHWYRNTALDISSASVPPVKSRFSLAVIILSIAVAAGFVRVAMSSMPMTIQLWDVYALQFSVTALAIAFWELLLYCMITTYRGYSSSRLRSV